MEEKITPVVGMGATYYGWTDRHPYTIIEVSKNEKTIKVQEDMSTRIDDKGMSDCQEYTYSPNPNGTIHTVTLRKNGTWVLKGDSIKGMLFGIGVRRRYHDYNF